MVHGSSVAASNGECMFAGVRRQIPSTTTTLTSDRYSRASRDSIGNSGRRFSGEEGRACTRSCVRRARAGVVVQALLSAAPRNGHVRTGSEGVKGLSAVASGIQSRGGTYVSICDGCGRYD